MDEIFDKVEREVFTEKTEPVESVSPTTTTETASSSSSTEQDSSISEESTSVPQQQPPSAPASAPPKVNMTDLFSGLFKSFLPDEMKNNKDVDKLFSMFLPKQAAASGTASVTGEQVENIVNMLFGKEEPAHAQPAAPAQTESASPVNATCDVCEKESGMCSCVCEVDRCDEDDDEETEDECDCEECGDDEDDSDEDECDDEDCEECGDEDECDDEDCEECGAEEARELTSGTKDAVFVITHDDEIKGYATSYEKAERAITRLHKEFASHHTTSFLRTKRTVGCLVVYERKMYTLLFPFSDEVAAVFRITMVPKL